MAGIMDGTLILDSTLTVTTSGENNDVPVQGSLMYISTTNELDSITGLSLGQNIGAFILLVNVSATNDLLIKNNSSSSASQNVIITADGLDFVVPPLNTAILGYDTTNQMWHVLRVPDVSLQSYQGNPSDPTGTTSSAGVMMGLSGSITPHKSGKIQIIVSGNIANNTSGDGAQTQIRYGTGTAPTNGAALTGTTAGALAKIVNSLLALLVPGSGNFTCNAIVSGLTLGTTYWVDLSLARITGGTATISGISISIIEL